MGWTSRYSGVISGLMKGFSIFFLDVDVNPAPMWSDVKRRGQQRTEGTSQWEVRYFFVLKKQGLMVLSPYFCLVFKHRFVTHLDFLRSVMTLKVIAVSIKAISPSSLQSFWQSKELFECSLNKVDFSCEHMAPLDDLDRPQLRHVY